MRLLLTLAIAVGSTAPVLAQTPDYRSFWPLTPGNAWVYVDTATSGFMGGTATGVEGSTAWTALDSVTVAAGRLPRVRIERSGRAPVECLVSFEAIDSGPAGGWFRLLDATGDAPCGVDSPVSWEPTTGDLSPGFTVYEASVVVEPVAIGGESYSSRRTSWGVSDSGGTGISMSWSWKAVDSLGLSSYSIQTNSLGGYSNRTDSDLRWAQVDGQTYGQPLASRPEFMPFDEGNVWQFALTDASGASFGAVEWAVTAPGTVRLRRVVDAAVVSDVTCPLTITPASDATGWQTRLALACTLPEADLFPALRSTDAGYWVDTVAEGVPVVIGAETVVATVAGGQWYRGSAPDGGGGATATWRAAENIGVVRYAVGRTFTGAPPVNRVAELAYARVGGIVYGQQVIAADGAPSTARLRLTAGPNPAAGSLTVHYALPAPSDARLTVVDALGREVRALDLGARPSGAGTERIALDGLAPGVYTVRLVTGGAVATARVSVVR